MQARDHDNIVVPDNEIHAIGKPVHQSAPDGAADSAELQRAAYDTRQDEIQFI
jgi:hypothetical protein